MCASRTEVSRTALSKLKHLKANTTLSDRKIMRGKGKKYLINSWKFVVMVIYYLILVKHCMTILLTYSTIFIAVLFASVIVINKNIIKYSDKYCSNKDNFVVYYLFLLTL